MNDCYSYPIFIILSQQRFPDDDIKYLFLQWKDKRKKFQLFHK